MFLKILASRILPLVLVSLLLGGCSLIRRPFKGRQAQTPQPPSAETLRDTAPSQSLGAARGPIDVDFLINYYDQDGDHSPVTGGIGTEDLQVIAPTFVVRWAPSERWNLLADLGVDNITSASTDNIDRQVSSASRQDSRGHAVFSATRNWENQRLTFGAGFSTEYDYSSLNGRLSWSRDFNQKNTTLTAGLGFYSDTIDLYDIDGVNQGEDDRTTVDFSLALTHNFSPRTVGSVELAISDQSGFLSTPFHEVILTPTVAFPDGQRVAERLPDSRQRTAVALSLQHAFSPKVVQRVYVRLYDDDWGIQAQTIEAETHFRLPWAQESWIFPILRFHTQDGSDYFGLPRTFTGNEAFFTADRDLSELTSEKFGMGLRMIFKRDRTGPLRFVRGFETRLTSYSRDDGLDAISASFAWRFRF